LWREEDEKGFCGSEGEEWTKWEGLGGGGWGLLCDTPSCKKIERMEERRDGDDDDDMMEKKENPQRKLTPISRNETSLLFAAFLATTISKHKTRCSVVHLYGLLDPASRI